MTNYLQLLGEIMTYGDERQTRNAVTRALFAKQLTWDLRDGFPVITTKEIKIRSIVGELLWFLSGSTNDNDLRDFSGFPPDKKTIWTANAEDFAKRRLAKYPGDLGRIYGEQWRYWRGLSAAGEVLKVVSIDQIADVIHRVKNDPYDRRLIVSAWNPADLPEMALPACHVMFQLFCESDNTISLSMVQRSCDTFLGVPYNITSYALLLSIIAMEVGRFPKKLSILFQDVHIYQEHFEAVEEQLKRMPYALPTLKINKKPMNELTVDDFTLENYNCHPPIKATMIV